MVTISNSDARTLTRIAETLRQVKSDNLRVINAVRQLQQLKTKINKQVTK